jgi:phosphorylcholine metabolism protein LicD
MNKFRNYLFFISKNIYLRFKYPRYFTLPIQHIHTIDMLLIFLEILKPKKIDFFLLYGSLLGAIRQESFAGRPKDIDLGIKEDHLPKLLDAFPLLTNKKTGVLSVRIYDKLSRVQFLFPFAMIDVEIFRKKNGVWAGEEDVFPANDLEHLKSVKVYGKNFLVPVNSVKYLQKKYGKNWKIPDTKKQFVWNKNY